MNGSLMTRRLYFLLPDVDHARQVLNHVVQNGVTLSHIHIVAHKDVDTGSLPAVTRQQFKHQSDKIEHYLWNGNLILFFLAFVVGLYLIVIESPVMAAGTFIVMVLTYLGGKYFVEKIPNTHISNFQSAISHGEVLLIVDLPKSHVNSIANIIKRQHPEAVPGGVGWTIQALHI